MAFDRNKSFIMLIRTSKRIKIPTSLCAQLHYISYLIKQNNIFSLYFIEYLKYLYNSYIYKVFIATIKSINSIHKSHMTQLVLSY